MHFEFSATVTVDDDEFTASEAREFIRKALQFINKNPDGPRIYLDDKQAKIES